VRRPGLFTAALTEEDEDVFPMDAEGQRVGVVTGVEDGVACVEPESNVAEAWIRSLASATTT
jgi:hypothetical protein